MSRKLASVQIIRDLADIPNADKIEVATINEWRVVVKKGEFKVGDKCIYFEIDSIVPPLPSFSFLEATNYRLKTVMLRGQISQGLAMPLNILSEMGFNIEIQEEKEPVARKVYNGGVQLYTLTDGFDLTDIIGITKYEDEPVELGKGITGYSFPSQYVHHTDLERIQNKPQLIDELRGYSAYGLQKIDGQSFTAIYNVIEDELLIASADKLIVKDYPEASNIYLEIAERYDLKKKLKESYAFHLSEPEKITSVAIQCELAGPGIRKNRLGLAEKELFLFNVAYTCRNMFYANLPILESMSKALGIRMPKMVFLGDFKFESVVELLKFAEQDVYENGHPQEGVVFKPVVEKYSKTLCGRLQFKVISNKYLLKIKG